MKKIVQLSMLLLSYNIAFNQAGKFDTSFSRDGKKIILFNKPTSLHAMALQTDGKIIAVGTVDSLFTIIRYNTNGSTDKTFGDNGIVTGLRGEANAVAIQDNGRIVVAGITSKPHGDKTYYNIIVARFTIHGNVDSGFGKNGLVTINIGAVDYCKAVAIQPDGKIVLAGTTRHSYYAYTKALLVRLNTDGSYDTNFGDSGKVMVFPDKYGITIGSSSTIRTMVLQADGKIIIGGAGADVNGSDGDYTVLMRFKRNGDLDKSFGNEGRADFDQISIYDIAVQSNDKIVCAGSALSIRFDNYGNYYYVTVPELIRYTANGILDKTYGHLGWAHPFQPGSIEHAGFYSVALLPNNESVSTLQHSLPNDTTLAVLRYNTKGETDSAFSNDGEKAITTPYLQSNTSPSTPILVQPDGKIVVGCTYDSSGFYVARLLGSKEGNENIYSAAQAVKNTNITKNNFSVYPNPAKTYTTVSFSGAGNYIVKLNDANGNILQTKNIKAVKGLNTMIIDVSNYAAGLYFITLMDDKKQVQTLMFNKL